MPHPTQTLTTLAAAGLITVLTAPGAAAQERLIQERMIQERITLESIGAVRMARIEEVRGADPELGSVQAEPARDPDAGRRTAKAR